MDMPVRRVTITHPDIATALAEILDRPGLIAVGRGWLLPKAGGGVDILTGPLRRHPLQLPLPAEHPIVVLGTDTSVEVLPKFLLDDGHAGHPIAAIWIRGRGTIGRIEAWVEHGGSREPVETLRIIGPGLPIYPRPDEPSWSPEPTSLDSWSRTAGALGLPAWNRLRALTVGVVGCGRLGSLVAVTIAKLGIKHLVLVDPDRLELHNLDAMDGVTLADIGRLKVEALADGIRQLGTGTQITTCPWSVSTHASLAGLRAADVLVSSGDHDGARWATGILATLFLQPLIDMGTGVFGHGPEREVGADIRLIMPGEACLACFGGVANEAQVTAIRGAEHVEHMSQLRREWRRERAGSLRSLNQIAAGQGVRLLEDLISEYLLGSIWIRFVTDVRGEPRIETIRPAPASHCAICSVRGSGEHGIAALLAPPLFQDRPV